jgi:hypothetical protein
LWLASSPEDRSRRRSLLRLVVGSLREVLLQIPLGDAPPSAKAMSAEITGIDEPPDYSFGDIELPRYQRYGVGLCIH